MGCQFEFKCGKCGYKASVAGETDCGEEVIVETMRCERCHSIVDVLVGWTEAGARLNPHRDKSLKRCPKCGAYDLAVWEKSRPCPKCDGRMTKGECSALWD